MKHLNSKYKFLESFCILLIVGFILAMWRYGLPQIHSTPTEQKLLIHVEPSDEITFIRHESLNKMHERDIQCCYITNVTIEIDNKQLPLEEAIRDGKISLGEIFAYARIDAQKGFCTETYASRHGVSHFTYQYPNFHMRIIYDIYETPDGQQHLISDFMLLHPDESIGTYTDFRNPDGSRLDLEDWGLEFGISNVNRTGLTLNCKQSEGQQIGSLVLKSFSISQNSQYVTKLDGSPDNPTLDTTLQPNGVTDVRIEWSQNYGKLSPGNYQIQLIIQDVFDESQVHPLMDDFHDWQVYTLSFAVPE